MMEKNARVVQEMDESCKIVVGCAVGVTELMNGKGGTASRTKTAVWA